MCSNVLATKKRNKYSFKTVRGNALTKYSKKVAAKLHYLKFLGQLSQRKPGVCALVFKSLKNSLILENKRHIINSNKKSGISN